MSAAVKQTWIYADQRRIQPVSSWLFTQNPAKGPNGDVTLGEDKYERLRRKQQLWRGTLTPLSRSISEAFAALQAREQPAPRSAGTPKPLRVRRRRRLLWTLPLKVEPRRRNNQE